MDWPPATRTVALLGSFATIAACSAVAGQIGAKEWLAMTPLLIGAMLPARVLVPCSRTVFALLAVAVLVALQQPEERGTHRWLHVPGLGHAQVGVPLAMATVLAAGCAVASWSRLGIPVVGAILLIATRSFSAAGIALTPLALHGRTRTRLIVAGTGLVVLVVLLFNNPNRTRRIAEHFGEQTELPYQQEQLDRVWSGVRMFGPGPGAEIHLPAAHDDLAFVDLARTRGGAFGLLVLALHAGVVWWLYRRAMRDGDTHPAAAGAAVVYSELVVGHLLVNFAVLPPTGIPMPFVGRGTASWLALSILLMPQLAQPWQPVAMSPTPQPVLAIAKWSTLAVLATAAVMCVARAAVA